MSNENKENIQEIKDKINNETEIETEIEKEIEKENEIQTETQESDTNLDALIEQKKHELQEILEANQFMKQQIDLFAAFLWRHQQMNKLNKNTNNQTSENIQKIDNNNINTNNTNETAINDKSNDKSIDNTITLKQNEILKHKTNDTINNDTINNDSTDIELTVDEYEQLEKQLPLELRLKMALTEKYLIKQEIAKLINKSDKDVSTLKAVLEECRARMAETKKDAYDFKRDIVIASQLNK